MRYIPIIIITILIYGCFPDEDPIKAPERDGSVIGSSDNLSVYESQIYYNLDKNEIVKSLTPESWDIGFSCDQDFYAILNYAGAMSVYEVKDKTFDEINREDALSVAQEDWVYDRPEGPEYGTALGKELHKGKSSVFIINRSLISKSTSVKYVKIRFIKSENGYKFKYQFLNDDAVVNEVQINKAPVYNYIGFSFDTGEQLTVEPEKENWHLLFTHNTEFLEAEPGDTLVYGVKSALINPYYAEAVAATPDTLVEVLDSEIPFSKIQIEDALKFSYSNRRNVIGHEWKDVDISNGQYTVKDDNIYFIRDLKSVYYKLHFVDYYYQGAKGYPKFEYEKL